MARFVCRSKRGKRLTSGSDRLFPSLLAFAFKIVSACTSMDCLPRTGDNASLSSATRASCTLTKSRPSWNAIAEVAEPLIERVDAYDEYVVDAHIPVCFLRP